MDGTTTISIAFFINIAGFAITIFAFKNTTRKDIEERAEARGATNAKLDTMLIDVKSIKNEMKDNANAFKVFGERLSVVEADVRNLKTSLEKAKNKLS